MFSLFSLANFKRSFLFGFLSDISILHTRSHSWKLFWDIWNPSYNAGLNRVLTAREGLFFPPSVLGRRTFAEHRTNILRQSCRRIHCACTSPIGKKFWHIFVKQVKVAHLRILITDVADIAASLDPKCGFWHSIDQGGRETHTHTHTHIYSEGSGHKRTQHSASVTLLRIFRWGVALRLHCVAWMLCQNPHYTCV